jgi:hypothetical protein
MKISGKKSRWISNSGTLVVVPICIMKTYEEMEVYLHLVFNLSQNGTEYSASCFGCFDPGKRLSTH